MASASAAKSASAFITLMTRRGYAAAASSQSVVKSAGAPTRFIMMKKGSPEESVKSAWAPDPVTGYYRPENHAKEVDAAELRRVLLSKNIRAN